MYKSRDRLRIPPLSVELSRAKTTWGPLRTEQLDNLRYLLDANSLSLLLGDITLLDGNWYVTHSGLLRLARAKRCRGITVMRIRELCDPSMARWAFKARVYTSPACKGFVGFADADPSNVPEFLRGAEMRIAETRAVNRALRKAYGIGLCSVEELSRTSPPATAIPNQENGNGHHPSGNGRPLLRDRLCRVIRTYHLDPESVKRYAADFCGTTTLRDASRELVEDFVKHLEQRAAHEHQALVAHLETYACAERQQSHEAAEAKGA
jgi:hypothetical protein